MWNLFRGIMIGAAFAALILTLAGCSAVHIRVDERFMPAKAKCSLSNGMGTWYLTVPGTTTILPSRDPLTVTCEKDGKTRSAVMSAEWQASKRDQVQ